MINLIIPSTLLLILSYMNIKRKQGWNYPSSILLLLYLFSLICAFPYVFIFEEQRIFMFNYLEASIVFCSLLLFFFYPFISFREDKIERIILPSQGTLNLFSFFVCILSIYSLIYFIPTTIKSFSVPDIRYARQMMVHNGEHITSDTVFNTIAGTVASFYQIPMILFFIYNILDVKKRLRNMLLISSLSYVFFVFSAFGRDGVVFWALSFLGIAGFFKPFLKQESNKIINRLFILFILVAVPFFMIITLSRFRESPFDAILSYIGQGIPNFFLAYDADVPITHGSSFPLFRSILGLSESVDTSMQKFALEEGGTYSYVFGTFLKSFIINFDVSGSVLLAIALFVFFKITLKRGSVMKFSSLFVYFLYFMIFYQGVFYFRQSNRVGNLVIIVCVLFYFFFSIIMNEERENCIVIEKN